ncbi:MAG: C40 family peptidase [Spirochaetes bacterium]|jgi:hypothetical protein|nr:C40 family peptidase [Spirochaetota bacterium]
MRKVFPVVIFIITVATFLIASATPVSQEEKTVRMSIIMVANKCVGIGYLFNGTTPKGFDNTGFVLYVYYKNGIELPRTVLSMFRAGEYVDPKNAKPGDLLFFLEDPVDTSSINHVGLYLGKDKFIHMPGEGSYVRIDRLVKDSKWSARFAGVKSYAKLFSSSSSSSKDSEPVTKQTVYGSSSVEFETSEME